MYRFRTLIYLGMVVVFLAYSFWMIGPYLRSVIVRDASVTTWSRYAVAPIAGRLDSHLPLVGDVIDGDGKVATIRNELLLDAERSVEDTRDRVWNAKLKMQEAEHYLADLKEMEQQRGASRARHAEVFLDHLTSHIRGLRLELDAQNENIARQKSLADGGVGSQALPDGTLAPFNQMKARQAQITSALNLALIRKEAADNDIFILENGEAPDWEERNALQLQLELTRADHNLRFNKSVLQEAEADLASQQRTLEKLSMANVTVPQGSIVFSLHVSPGATVDKGDKILAWIDCSKLMLDVPVSEAEMPLIKIGSTAEVILEGEAFKRQAKVLLARGASAVLGRVDLAAPARTRNNTTAQVLMELKAKEGDFESCPVGRSAYVNFPDVGLIDVLRARLRL